MDVDIVIQKSENHMGKTIHFDCNHCKKLFEIKEDKRYGIKWARCPFCNTVYRYDLSKSINSVNCNDMVADW